MEKLKISIETLPNGYALDVDKEMYMYHSLEGLIEGFMFHVGLREPAYSNSEFIKDFLATAIAWKTGDNDIVRQVISLTNENERLTSALKSSKKEVKRLRDRIRGKVGNVGAEVDDDDDDNE